MFEAKNEKGQTVMLHTKKEIADIWSGSIHKDEPTCPYCRDNLANAVGRLYCQNLMCKNNEIYTLEKEDE